MQRSMSDSKSVITKEELRELKIKARRKADRVEANEMTSGKNRVFGDKRTKRNRDRSTQNRKAIQESIEND